MPQEPDDIEADIEAVMNKLDAGEGPASDPSPEPTGGDELTEGDEPPAGTVDAYGNVHDPENGKFAGRKPADAEGEGEPPAEGEAPPEEPGEAEPPAEGTTAQITPRPEWSAEDHEAFHKLQPEAQKFVLDRVTAVETAAAERMKDFEAVVPYWSEVDQAVAPFREVIRAQRNSDGTPLTDGQAISNLMNMYQKAAADPAAYIRWFAQQAGIDPAQVFGGQPTGGEGEPYDSDPAYEDPQIAAIRREMGTLREAMQGIAGRLNQEDTRAAEQNNQTATKMVEDFRSELDEQGNLKHPYFDHLTPRIKILLDSDGDIDLHAAYEQAAWSDPETRAKLQAAQKAAQESEAQRERDRKRAAAQRAASSVTGAPSAGPTRVEPDGDVFDAVRAAADRVYAGRR